ncbi:MAG: hypothetical protein JST89_20995 [Cyanobacteria bacterium SZAS-4]|nr:hypothetical protein [Cyanobacteria bacterium SZAS-4]
MPLLLLLLLGAFFYSNCQIPATAKAAHRSSNYQRYSDGVTVRKNADGTVETFDSGSSPESFGGDVGQVQEAGQTYRPPIVSKAYSRVIGGVHVKRNSDGTVETYEAPSRPVSLYPTAPRAPRAKRHAK